MGILEPYLLYVKLGVGALLVAFIFVGGCRYGANGQIKAKAEVEKALIVSQAERDGAANALNEVNRQARFQEEKAKEAARNAATATKLADRYQREMLDREAAFADQLRRAARKPSCKALLDIDVKRECNL